MTTLLLGGYSYDFVEPPCDELICLLCTFVCKDPQQIQCCGKVCCNDCLNVHLQHSNSCPQCRKDLSSFSDTRSNRHIQELKVKCENATNGCEWAKELRYYEAHLFTCGYALIACPNNCMEGGKEVKVLRRELNNHLISNCRKRKYQCLHCDEDGEYDERTTTHLDECPKVKVHCPNEDCNDSIPRCEIPHHRKTCEHERVECKYAVIGCDTKIPCRNLSEHENNVNSQCHLLGAVGTVLKLKKQQEVMLEQNAGTVADLKQQKALIEQHITRSKTFKFKVARFQELKKSKDEFVSPPFHSHPGGYKMCIVVCPGGEGKAAEDTHVSVYACLMRGRNDDNLPWPFIGTATITLLNQLEDKNHHQQSVTFRGDNECSERVVNGKRGKGYGRTTFISHADLHSENRQYLNDDILYFQVSVEAADNLKPWLTC